MSKMLRKSAFDGAFKTKLELIDIPNQYLRSFYLTQVFESLLEHLLGYLISSVRIMVLKQSSGAIDYRPAMPDVDKMTVHQIYERLKTFLGDPKYERLINAIGIAINTRNKFIHNAFKPKKGQLFTLTDNKFYLQKEARQLAVEWLKAYHSFAEELDKVTSELSKLRSL